MNRHHTYRKDHSLNSPWAVSLNKRHLEPVSASDAVADHLLRVHRAMFKFAAKNAKADTQLNNRILRRSSEL